MSAQQSRTTVGALETAVVDLIQERGGLAPGEIVVHFELVSTTRCIVNGEESIDRRRWSAPGADPHTSYGVLDAAAKQILFCNLT